MNVKVLRGGKVLVRDGSDWAWNQRTLVIKDGVLSRSTDPDAESCRVDHDVTGKWIVPGLWDAHVHLGSLVPPHDKGALEQDPRHHMARCIAKAQENLMYGVTSVRSLGERDSADLMLRDFIEAGHLVGPSIYASGDVHWSLEECGVDNYRRQVRELVLAGVDIVKLLITGGIPFKGSIFSPTARQEELEAAIREAHEWGKPVAVHAMGDDAVRMAAESGADCIEHAFGCTEAVVEPLRSAGAILSPQLSVTDCWTRDSVHQQGLPGWMADNAESARRGHHEMFGAAVEAGVMVVAGVDMLPRGRDSYGMERVGDDSGLIHELSLMVSLGMSPGAAIAAASVNVARSCGAEDVVGLLEEGMAADLVVLGLDPLESIENLTAVESVWKRGNRVVQQTAGY